MNKTITTPDYDVLITVVDNATGVTIRPEDVQETIGYKLEQALKDEETRFLNDIAFHTKRIKRILAEYQTALQEKV